MKSIIKILVSLVLLGALGASLYLVSKRQETRRGAAGLETSAQILPSNLSKSVGETFSVNLWVNTGGPNDKLSGAELNVGFDATKLEYLGADGLNGYTLLDVLSEGGSDKYFKLITLGEEKSGAMELVRLNFRALTASTTNISINYGDLMMLDEDVLWNIPVFGGATVLISGAGDIPCSSDANCPVGQKCVSPVVVCVKEPCPRSARVCRPTGTTIVPSRRPTSPAGKYPADFDIKMVGAPTMVGQKMVVNVVTNSYGKKVSGAKIRLKYDPNTLTYVSSSQLSGGSIVGENVNVNTGFVDLSVVWSKPSDVLVSSPDVATVAFVVKKAGIVSVETVVDSTNQIVGVDELNNPIAFTLGPGQGIAMTRVAETSMCTECASGLSRSTGNANCDGVVNLSDFEVWRSEMFDKGGSAGMVKNNWGADYNCDSRVSGLDFEIWRRSVFK